jgi:hypothetical protein
VSRSLQLYPSNCIQQDLEKLAVAALLRRFLALNETRQFVKMFTAFGTGSYPEPDTSNPLLVPIKSQTHPVLYWFLSRARYIRVRYWSLSKARENQSASGPYPEPDSSSPLLVPILS